MQHAVLVFVLALPFLASSINPSPSYAHAVHLPRLVAVGSKLQCDASGLAVAHPWFVSSQAADVIVTGRMVRSELGGALAVRLTSIDLRHDIDNEPSGPPLAWESALSCSSRSGTTRSASHLGDEGEAWDEEVVCVSAIKWTPRIDGRRRYSADLVVVTAEETSSGQKKITERCSFGNISVVGLVNVNRRRHVGELVRSTHACFVSHRLLSRDLPATNDAEDDKKKRLCTPDPTFALIRETLPSSRQAQGEPPVSLIDLNQQVLVKEQLDLMVAVDMPQTDDGEKHHRQPDEAVVWVIYTFEEEEKKHSGRVPPVFIIPNPNQTVAFSGSLANFSFIVRRSPSWIGPTLPLQLTFNLITDDVAGAGLSIPYDMKQWDAISTNIHHPLYPSFITRVSSAVVFAGEDEITVTPSVTFLTSGLLLCQISYTSDEDDGSSSEQEHRGGKEKEEVTPRKGRAFLLRRTVMPVFHSVVRAVVPSYGAFLLSDDAEYGLVSAFLSVSADCNRNAPSAIQLQKRHSVHMGPEAKDQHYHLKAHTAKIAPSVPYHVCLLLNRSFWLQGDMLVRLAARKYFSADFTHSTLNGAFSSPHSTINHFIVRERNTVLFGHSIEIKPVILDEQAGGVTVVLYASNVAREEQSLSELRVSLELMPIEPYQGREYKLAQRGFQFCSRNSTGIRRAPSMSPQAAEVFARKLQRNGVGLPPLAVNKPYPLWIVTVAQPGEYAICLTSAGVIDFAGVASVPGPRLTQVVAPVLPSTASRETEILIFRATTCARQHISFSVVEGSAADLLSGGVRFTPFRGEVPTCTREPRAPLSQVRKPLFYEEIHHRPPTTFIDRLVTATVTFPLPGNYTLCFTRADDRRLKHPDKLKETFLLTLLGGELVQGDLLHRGGAGNAEEKRQPFLVLGANKTNKWQPPDEQDLRTVTVIEVRWQSAPSLVRIEAAGHTGLYAFIGMPTMCAPPRSLVWGTTCSSNSTSTTTPELVARSFRRVDSVLVVTSDRERGVHRLLVGQETLDMCRFGLQVVLRDQNSEVHFVVDLGTVSAGGLEQVQGMNEANHFLADGEALMEANDKKEETPPPPPPPEAAVPESNKRCSDHQVDDSDLMLGFEL